MLGEPDLYVVVDVECHRGDGKFHRNLHFHRSVKYGDVVKIGGVAESVRSHLDFTAPLYSKVAIVPAYVDLSGPRHVYQVRPKLKQQSGRALLRLWSFGCSFKLNRTKLHLFRLEGQCLRSVRVLSSSSPLICLPLPTVGTT